jgi:hypothetical protein
VLRPTYEVDSDYVEYTRIHRTGAKDINDVRVRDTRGVERRKPLHPKDRKFREDTAERRGVRTLDGGKRMVAANDDMNRNKTASTARKLDSTQRVIRRSTVKKTVVTSDAAAGKRVVRSSRDSFLKSRENSAKIRKQLESKKALKKSTANRGSAASKKVEKKTARKSASKDAVRDSRSNAKEEARSAKRTKS